MKTDYWKVLENTAELLVKIITWCAGVLYLANNNQIVLAFISALGGFYLVYRIFYRLFKENKR